MQQGLLAECRLSGVPGVNIEQITGHLLHALDAELFEAAWRRVFIQLDAMRMQFFLSEAGDPRQRVAPLTEIPFEVIDWTTKEGVNDAFVQFLAEDRKKGVDPFAAPATRVTLFKVGPEAWRFVWTFHHCLFDGSSHATVLDRVFSVYTDLSRGVEPNGTAVTPYASFLEWLERQDPEPGRRHFVELLRGFAEPTALPLHRTGDLTRSYQNAESSCALDAETTRSLVAFAKQHEVTLNTVVQLAWGLMLGRYDDSDDVVFGATWSGRQGEGLYAQRIAGLLINTVPVRVNLCGGSTVSEALRSLREQHLQLRPFQHTSLSEIAAASEVPTTRLAQSVVVFDYERFPSTLSPAGPAWDKREFALHSQTGNPLTLCAWLHGERLHVSLEYDRGLYEAQHGRQLLAHYTNLLCNLASSPDASIHDVQMLDPTVYRALTEQEAKLERAAPLGTVLDAIAEQVMLRPDHLAIETPGGEGVTYRELDERARSIAASLQSYGLDSGEPVALFVSRSPEAVAAMIGVLTAGGAFLPVDPTYPESRVDYMLKDARVRIVIVDKSTESQLPGGTYQVVRCDFTGAAVEVSEARLNTESPAYVIYTSGSTGEPKGVCVSHGSLLNHGLAIEECFELTPDDRVLQFAALSFDVAVEEIIPTLMNGATLILRSDDMIWSASAFFGAVEQAAMTVLNLPTAFWHAMTHDSKAGDWPKSVRLVVVGGERASEAAHRKFRSLVGDGVRWLNGYGPTETTITSTVYDDAQSDHADALPIGQPVSGVSHFILDAHLRPMPPGAAGQLYIGGAGVALGYLHREQLTNERFVPHPWRPGARLYATGDLARRTRAGNYVFVDRVDDQVKVRGYRIELGEIEACVRAHPAVSEAAVVVQQGDALVAFITATEPADAIRRHAQDALPHYMVPDMIVLKEALPRTPAGKIDRQALAQAAPEKPLHRGASETASDPLKARLVHMWERILGEPVPATSASFFLLGGHSLLVMKMFSEIERTLQCSCDPRGFFREPTIDGLARLIRSNSGTDWTAPFVQLSKGREDVLPLFLTPGVTGRAVDYVHVAEHLGADVPIYALQIPGLREGKPRHDRLADAAREYCELMKSAQPSGPYAVAGYSSGAIVALAVADALVKEGKEVDFLGFIDGTPPHTVPIPSPFTSPRRLLRVSRTVAGRVAEVYEQGDFLTRFPRRAGSAVLRSASRWFPWLGEYEHTVDNLFQDAQIDLAPEQVELMQHQLQTSMRYRPGNVRVDAVLFRTRLDPFEGPHEPDLAWGRVIDGNVVIETLCGRHKELLAKPGARELAGALRSHLMRRRTR